MNTKNGGLIKMSNTQNAEVENTGVMENVETTDTVESTEPKHRGRKSETTEFTQDIFNKLLDTGAFDEVKVHGNTVIAMFDKENGFKFRAIPLGGIVLGIKEAKYSVEACINSVAEFIREYGLPSSTKYNVWVKGLYEKDANNKKTYPNTHNVMLACGCWPARAILVYMLQGKLADATVEEIIEKQKELDAQN